jgi:5-methylcytosine-specific restriction endonuclease McrA
MGSRGVRAMSHRAPHPEYYQKNREKALEYQKLYRERNRERVLETQSACRAANPGAKAEWCAANPERSKANGLAGKHRRRARLAQQPSDLSGPSLRGLLASADGLCSYCLMACDELQVEHCTPLARGGGHVQDNVVAACAVCNNRKGSRTVLEMLPGWPGQ